MAHEFFSCDKSPAPLDLRPRDRASGTDHAAPGALKSAARPPPPLDRDSWVTYVTYGALAEPAFNEIETESRIMATDAHTDQPTTSSDRRSSSRVPFNAVLAVTEYDGGPVPATSEFREVKAVNLSQTGISFATADWPKSDRLIVMLGNPQKPTFVVTRVVGCVQQSARDGEPCVRVHGEFEDWILQTQTC